MKDIYAENNKTFMKEIREDSKKWQDILCSWIERINIIKMAISNLQIHSDPYQITHDIFHKTRTNNPKNLYGTIKNPELPKQS